MVRNLMSTRTVSLFLSCPSCLSLSSIHVKQQYPWFYRNKLNLNSRFILFYFGIRDVNGLNHSVSSIGTRFYSSWSKVFASWKNDRVQIICPRPIFSLRIFLLMCDLVSTDPCLAFFRVASINTTEEASQCQTRNTDQSYAKVSSSYLPVYQTDHTVRCWCIRYYVALI